jgi:hypothetical protein
MRDANLTTVLEDFFNYKTSEMYTSIPCRIVTVRSSLNDQRVDVQPLTNRVLPDGVSREQPPILNVPVIFPASKTAAMTFPVDVGDTVLCVFSQRSTDGFKASSGASTYTAQDKRRFSIRDAIAIPGLFPFETAVNNPAKRKWTHSTRDLVLVNNIGKETECEFRLKDNGNIEMKTDQDFYATFKNGLIECNNLTVNATGNFTVTAGDSISMTAANDLNLQATNWSADISGATNIKSPTTNWTGIFNLAGTLSMTGGAGGGGIATIDAPLTINNSVTVVGSDVTADGIGLKSHSHSNPEGGNVGPSTG